MIDHITHVELLIFVTCSRGSIIGTCNVKCKCLTVRQFFLGLVFLVIVVLVLGVLPIVAGIRVEVHADIVVRGDVGVGRGHRSRVKITILSSFASRTSGSPFGLYVLDAACSGYAGCRLLGFRCRAQHAIHV